MNTKTPKPVDIELTDAFLVAHIRAEIAAQRGELVTEILHAPCDFDLTEFLKKQAD